MSEIIIASGVTSTGLVAESGDIITVQSGGALVNGVVNDGATLNATYGAILEDLTAATGATVELSVAAKTSGAILRGANTNIAEGTLHYMGTAITGQVVNGVLTNLGGAYRFCPGAGITVSDPTVGGEATVKDRVYAWETAVVSGGQITTNGNLGLLGESYGNEVTVGGDGVTAATLNTFDQATVDNITVSTGGNFQIRNAADNTTVNGGGWFQVYNGGAADGVTVNSGGTATVWAGGVANDVSVGSIGYLRVSGGTVNNVSIGSGGQLNVSGGVIDGGVISGGYYVDGKFTSTSFHVSGGGLLRNVTLTTIFNTNPGTQQAIFGRLGWTNTNQVGHGENITVEKWTQLQLANGTLSNTSVTTSAKLNVIAYANKGGFASATKTVVASGGTALTSSYSGKTNVEMTDTWLNQGGVAVIGSGGKMYDTVLNSGGKLTVSNSGVATLDDHPWIDKSQLTIKTGATVTSARNYNIYYGTDEDGLKSRTNDRQVDWQLNADSAVIYDGAVISGGEVADGATLVMHGGWVSGATFDKGATVYIKGGTVLDIAAVPIGGKLSVSGAALISGGYIGGDNNSANCSFSATNDAVLRNVTFTNVGNNSKSNVIWCYLGNTANSAAVGSADLYDCTVEKGARVQMYHGTAYDTDVISGGWFAIAWGSASRTNISGGQFNGAGEKARMVLYYDQGRTYETTVGSGGFMCVSKGKAFDTVVKSGGDIDVKGGSASGLVLEKGAVLRMSGGVVSGATIRTNVTGGYVTGGTIYDALIEGPSAAETLNFSMTKAAVMSGGVVKTDAVNTHVEQFFVQSNAKIYDVTFTTDIVAAGSNQNYTRLGWAAGNVGYAYRCTVQSGAKLQMNNGRVYDTTVKDGGFVVVWGYTADGAYAENTSVYGNGYNTWYYSVNKSSYGAVVQCYADAGKGQAIMSGAYVGSGGFIDVGVSGSVVNALVNSGGSVHLKDATAAVSLLFNPWTGKVTSTAGTVTSQTEAEREYKVYYGADDGHTGLIFRSNDDYENFVVEVGHSMHLYEGSAIHTIVQSGGVLSLGGAGASATVDFNPWGGTIVNEAGGTVTSQTFAEREYNIYYGTEKGGMVSRTNDADGATVSSGVSMIAYRGAEIDDLTLVKGGRVLLGSGAVVSGLDVNGGYVTFDAATSKNGIAYGASAYDVTLRNGAGVWFASGAYISGLNVESGGSVNCYHFGKIYDAVISNGGQMEFRTNGIATSNLIGGVTLDLAGSTEMNRYLVTRNFNYITDVLVKANGSVCNASYWICSNAGVTTAGNAFRLDIGGGMVYDTGDNGTTKIYDPLHDLTYSRTRTRIGETANYDLKLETILDYSGLGSYQGPATSLSQCGSALNGVDTGVRWTEEVFYDDTVYLAEGLNAGNAWLEVAGADISGALYGAAENQDFTGAVNLKLMGGSIKNLAAGAAAGGSVKAVNFRMTGGELGGNTYLGGMGDVTETVIASVDGGTLAADKNLFAGTLWNYKTQTGATSVGDISLTVSGAAEINGNVYGASAVKTGEIATTAATDASHTVGDVTLSLAGGTAAAADFCAFAGGYATGTDSAKLASVYDVDDVSLSITGGSWGDAMDVRGGRGVFGGVMASGVKATAQNVSITVDGTASVANVFGGGWAQKGGISTVENVEITVAGGTVANVFGSGRRSTQGESFTSVGNVSITLAGGNVTGNVFARGITDGDAVTGGASVTVTGSVNYGCNFYGFSRNTGEDDNAVLTFSDYTGTISGEVGGFKEITLAGDTEMAFDTAAKVTNTAWIFDVAERTTSATAFASCETATFSGATISLDIGEDQTLTGAWSIFAGGEGTTYGEFDVLVGGTSILPGALTLDEQIADGDYAGWGFTVEDTVLKFKNLA